VTADIRVSSSPRGSGLGVMTCIFGQDCKPRPVTVKSPTSMHRPCNPAVMFGVSVGMLISFAMMGNHVIKSSQLSLSSGEGRQDAK